MMRRAAVAAALALAAAPALSQTVITAARYTEPTTRYAHGVLGDAVEWGALRLTVTGCAGCFGARDLTLRLPQTRVFEDTAPRLADLDGDGGAEVIVVESDLSLGARLAVYDETGLVAATPFIGQAHRWLAPVGAGDLDGDGHMEIAYVDRPHLAKTLRVWRFKAGRLTEVASRSGLSNHRIGEDVISGGVRDCTGTQEIITADADWTRIVASTLTAGRINSRDIGAFTGPQSFADALSCR